MKLEQFVDDFAAEFENTPREAFSPTTKYKDLDEWSSLVALSIISMVDDKENKTIFGKDLRQCQTIEELYNLIQSKSE